MGWLLWSLCAQAASFGERGGLGLSASAGPELGCLGVEAVLMRPDRARPSGRGSLPNRQRVVATIQGCGEADWSTIGVATGLGVGGQWGGRQRFVSASIVGGMAAWESDLGSRSIQRLGPWIRPKAALGLQLTPGFALEFGPSFQGFVPLLTQVQGAPPQERLQASVGLDLVLTAGSLAPRRWR